MRIIAYYRALLHKDHFCCIDSMRFFDAAVVEASCDRNQKFRVTH